MVLQVTHWQHPRFHAYFPAGNSFPSILGDMLSDAIGCVGFSWVSTHYDWPSFIKFLIYIITIFGTNSVRNSLGFLTPQRDTFFACGDRSLRCARFPQISNSYLSLTTHEQKLGAKEKNQSSTMVEKYFSIISLHYSYIIKRDTNSKTFKNEYSP